MTEMQPEDEVLDAITRVRVRYGLPSASLASQPFRFDPTWRRYAMLGRRIPCEPLGSLSALLRVGEQWPSSFDGSVNRPREKVLLS